MERLTKLYGSISSLYKKVKNRKKKSEKLNEEFNSLCEAVGNLYQVLYEKSEKLQENSQDIVNGNLLKETLQDVYKGLTLSKIDRFFCILNLMKVVFTSFLETIKNIEDEKIVNAFDNLEKEIEVLNKDKDENDQGLNYIIYWEINLKTVVKKMISFTQIKDFKDFKSINNHNIYVIILNEQNIDKESFLKLKKKKNVLYGLDIRENTKDLELVNIESIDFIIASNLKQKEIFQKNYYIKDFYFTTNIIDENFMIKTFEPKLPFNIEKKKILENPLLEYKNDEFVIKEDVLKQIRNNEGYTGVYINDEYKIIVELSDIDKVSSIKKYIDQKYLFVQKGEIKKIENLW